MKKILFLLFLYIFISFSYASDFKIGYLTGTHFITKDLSNSHPFVGISDNILIYQNSFKKIGFAIFNKENIGIFSVRMGFTTGYKQIMIYNNQEYLSPFTFYGVTPFIVPGIEFNLTNNTTFIAALMFDSLNVGVGFSF